ncbi:MAG: TIR domain-containing protein [Clostridia bacterium]|nr:TIR domain-containing protein [Clostridia bacterium]
MAKTYVFISYSSVQHEAATRLCEFLEYNGIECWIAPRNVHPGENYPTQIIAAIRSCSALVLLASEDTNASQHVSNEVSFAFDNHKPIIPFKYENLQFTDEFLYFLGTKHWIDASGDFDAGLHTLLGTLLPLLSPSAAAAQPQAQKPSPQIRPSEPKKSAGEQKSAVKSLSRGEMVALLKDKIKKFPYCLAEKLEGGFAYEAFKSYALDLFAETVIAYRQGKTLQDETDPVKLIVETLSAGHGNCIHVQGLPGCAKNMLLQLAYWKMLENFESGESDYLPVYLSSSYYEKIPYNPDDVKAQMKSIIGKELQEYFEFLSQNAEVKPVLFMEAIREHSVSSISPENVVAELWKPYGKFNRITTVDVGLIKNRARLKRAIPLTGDGMSVTFRFHSVPIADETACLNAVRSVIRMYRYDLDEGEIYGVLKKLRFPTIDIFLIRLVSKELISNYQSNDVSLTDMYEHLALNELNGDEDRMLSIATELFEYVFKEDRNINTTQYNGALWSLPHKHNTYLEFMIAYYFSHCILHYRELEDLSFIRTTMTSMENHFMTSRLADNYPLQEALLSLVKERYDELDLRQKSNAAYWLGKFSYPKLVSEAKAILAKESERLKPLVKTNYKETLENYSRQYLFRSVCNGLASYGQVKVLDDYLCLIVTNDVANAVNRGTIIEYMGDNYQMFAHDSFYLDTNPAAGEQAIRILSSRVEMRLNKNTDGFVENDLVSLLTLLQARMHLPVDQVKFNLAAYVEKGLALLRLYRTRPTNIVSEKLEFYFSSVEEDLEAFLNTEGRFDVGITMLTKLNGLKDVKRVQWTSMQIEDPESVSEHTFSAWMLGMVFLPEQTADDGYCKREVLDMLLIHDMAEAELGDQLTRLAEPKKDLKKSNATLRKMFLKGTYPEIANLTYYYNIWTGYYNGVNINARMARDINLLQTVCTFCEYCGRYPERFTRSDVNKWLKEQKNISTEFGYQLFKRLITDNPEYQAALAKVTD